jgi:acyl-CoA thioesterase I
LLKNSPRDAGFGGIYENRKNGKACMKRQGCFFLCCVGVVLLTGRCTVSAAPVSGEVIYATSFDGGVDGNWSARSGYLSQYDSDGNGSLDALRQTSQQIDIGSGLFYNTSYAMLYAADNPSGAAKGVKLGAAYPNQYTNNYRVTMNGYTQNSPGAIGIAVCANSTFTLVYQYTTDWTNDINIGYFGRMIIHNGTAGIAAGTYFGRATNYIPGFNPTQPHKYQVQVTGDQFSFWVDDVLIVQETSPVTKGLQTYNYALSSYRNGSVGVGAFITAAANNYVIRDFTVQYVDPPVPVRTAANRFPADNGTVDAANATTLYWFAGTGAVSHDVYFGTSQTAVTSAQRLLGDINGDGPTDIKDFAILAKQWLRTPIEPYADLDDSGSVNLADVSLFTEDWLYPGDTVYKGNQTATSLNVGTLPAGTYYWRVDEVIGSATHKGATWSFTVGQPAVKIMPLGDSITHGAIYWSNYRATLWNTLRNNGFKNIDFVGSHNTLAWQVTDPTPDNDHEGHGGWTADGLLYGGGTTAGGVGSINIWLTSLKDVDKVPDVVLMHIGTNDETYLGPTGDHTVTLNEIKGLIDVFRKYNPYVTVLVAKLIPAFASHHKGVEYLNALIPSLDTYETSTSQVYIVDHYTGFLQSWLTSDGVHPNATGAAQMSSRWYAALAPILPERAQIAPPAPPSVGISNFNRSGYAVAAGGLAVGEFVYTDRTYTFNSVASLNGATYIQTPNADKKGTGSVYLTFTADRNCTVYVAHDDTITSKPSWLSQFTDTTENLVTSDNSKVFSLYRKDFSAGTVTLGGNGGGDSSSMYSIVVVGR